MALNIFIFTWCTNLQYSHVLRLTPRPSIYILESWWWWVRLSENVCWGCNHPTPTFYVSRLHKMRMNRLLIWSLSGFCELKFSFPTKKKKTTLKSCFNFAFNESVWRTFLSIPFSWCNFDLGALAHCFEIVDFLSFAFHAAFFVCVSLSICVLCRGSRLTTIGKAGKMFIKRNYS